MMHFYGNKQTINIFCLKNYVILFLNYNAIVILYYSVDPSIAL